MPVTTSSQSRIDRIYSGLKARIDTMNRGERFLSVREVMNEYGVSQVTVDRAMVRLTREGLLVRTPKVGTFVADTARESRIQLHRIAVAVPNYPSSVYDAYIHALTQRVDRIGQLVHVLRYDPLDRLPLSPPRSEIDALVIIPTGQRLTPSDLHRISEFKLPTVMISRVLRDVTFDCVEPDNEIGGELAAQHLIELGHKRLAILLWEPAGVSTDSRIKGFLRVATRENLPEVEVIDCRTQPCENAAINAYKTLRAYLADRPRSFTGLFAISDATALGTLKALHDAKIAIPEQVSVVGFDDVPEAQLYHPALTTIRGDYDRVAETAIDIIERRLSGDSEDVIQTFIPPTLIRRESTGPAPTA